MPPRTRRAAGGPQAAGGQSRLSFNNRVSKPSHDVTAAQKHAKSKLSEPAQEIITSEIVKQSTPEPEVQVSTSDKGKVEQYESPVRILPSPSRKRKVRRSINDDDDDSVVSFVVAEKQAQKISDSQVKKYWKAEEDSRLAPRGRLH